MLETFTDGYALCADSTLGGTMLQVRQHTGDVPLIVCDPPYGNVVNVEWDRFDKSGDLFCDWMIRWTQTWTSCLLDNGAFYVWGGLGKPGFRPFLSYLSKVEQLGKFELANLITWSKKRAYGVKHNYLFTREELAYFVKGDAKKPLCFNIPLLNTKRGYAGYNKKYPAKSEFYRRTNVWSDVTEIMRGKMHPTQKVQRVIEIPIEVHTNKGDWVVDQFAGSGVTGHAARKLGRKFFLVEKDKDTFDSMVQSLRVNEPKKV